MEDVSYEEQYWEVYDETLDNFPWKHLSTEELHEEYRDTYDRWNFVTGSEEDFQLMKRMEAELSRRDYEKIFNEALDEQAKAIAKRIDDEILNSLLEYNHETDSMVSNKK